MAFTQQDLPDLTGRTALVTGANSGLGYHTSQMLAAAGARVLMACRSQGKAEAAMASIRQEAGDVALDFVALDLASLASVATAAEQVAGQVEALDILVNNAGIMAVPHALTPDGFETQIGTNHFGHFALTAALLPVLLMASAPRVVNVSSMAHRWTPGIDFDDLDWTRRRYRRWQAYGDSKIANLHFSYALARRAEAAAAPLLVAAAHPGYSDTHLQYVAAEQKSSAFEKAYMWLGNKLFAQSAAMGALPSVYAATMPDVVNGAYYGPDGFKQTRGHPTRVGSSRRSRDEATGERLWQVSEERCGLQFSF